MGHKTDSIYERYAFVAEQDLRDGLRKVANVAKKSSGEVIPINRRKASEE